jgi:hypothetical protein
MDQAVAQRIKELEAKEARLSQELLKVENRLTSTRGGPTTTVGRGLGRASRRGPLASPVMGL